MMMGKMRVEFGGQTLLVAYNYSEGSDDVMYLPNGDPGYPGDPEEFYITEVKLVVKVTDDLEAEPHKREVLVDIEELLVVMLDESAEYLEASKFGQLVFDTVLASFPEQEGPEDDY